MLDLAAIFISAILGWQIGTLSAREAKGIALAVAGWTAVDTITLVPYLSPEVFLLSLLRHSALVAIPYVTAMAIRRLARR